MSIWTRLLGDNAPTQTQKTVGSETTHQPVTTEEDDYSTLKRTAVLQEARCFNEKQINAHRCCKLLAKLIYLINQGERFLETESTELFFSITKLFQSENKELRRMIYLIIKEMQHESSIYIITQSLIKDMNAKEDLYRMNALRLSAVVIESQYLIQSERYIKNAIIDKVNAVSCSALLAGIHLYPSNAEFVKKWSNEIQEKLNSKSPGTHYHALILLNGIKKQDRNSFLKILVNLSKENACNGVAGVQLIRFIREMITSEEIDQQNERIFVDFLEKQLHKTSDMVGLEAAKTLCEFKSLPNKQIAPAVSLLTFFLTSSASVNKLAALRVMNKMISNPARVVLIQNISEVEGLLRENNRSLSAFAISILLKISKEDSVEQLLTQVEDFIGESSEEFKVDILSSVRALVKKHPRKYKAIVNFLSHCLKNEGQYQFKSAAVACLENVIQEIPDAREIGLFTLAEYIEDCQFPSIHIQVMNLLAKEAQNISNPGKLARLINNRTVLEGPEIRAAAITTLGKLVISKNKLVPQIQPVLEMALEDTDSEVRGRAAFYLDEIKRSRQAADDALDLGELNMEEVDYIEAFLQKNIEEVQRAEDPSVLDLGNISRFVKENKLTVKKTEAKKKGPKGALDEGVVVEVEKKGTEGPLFKKYQAFFNHNPQFEGVGPLRLVLNDKEITDPQAEYQVKARKIFFDDYLVLEYSVKNMLENHVLFDVTVDVQIDVDDLKPMQIISVNQIKTHDTASVFVTVAKNPEFKIIIATINSFLKFKIAEFSSDGKTKLTEYEDEYQLDEFQVTVNDYIQPHTIPVEKKFETVWKTLAGAESEASYQLEYKTLEAAIDGLVRHFGMHVCENSNVINMANKAHSLMLSGTYLGHTDLLLHALIGFQPEKGCLMKLKSRSPDEVLASDILECVK